MNDEIIHTSSVRSVGSTGTDTNTDNTSVITTSLSSSQIQPPPPRPKTKNIENQSLLSAVDYHEDDDEIVNGDDEDTHLDNTIPIQQDTTMDTIKTNDRYIEKKNTITKVSSKVEEETQSTTVSSSTTMTTVSSSSSLTRSKQVFGMFLVLSASLAFSCMALFVSMLGNTLPSLQSNWIRFMVQVLLTTVTIILNALKENQLHTLSNIYTWLGPREQWFRLLQRGLWGVGGMGSYFYALQSVSLADATALVFINVPLTALFAHFLLKEPYGIIDVGTGLLCMLGVVFISQPPVIFGNLDNHSSPISWIVIIVIFLGSCCSAMAYITIRTIGSGVSPLTVVLWFSLVGTVFAPILAFALQSFTDLTTLTSVQSGLILGIGFCGWVGQILLNRGIALSPVGPATVMRYADVVFALIFQSTLLHDPPGGLKLFGVFLIMSCVVGSLYKQQIKNKEAVTDTPSDTGTVTTGTKDKDTTVSTDTTVKVVPNSGKIVVRLSTIASSISLDDHLNEKGDDIQNILIVEENDDQNYDDNEGNHQQELINTPPIHEKL